MRGTTDFGLVPNTLSGFGLSTDLQHVPDVSSAAHSYPNQTDWTLPHLVDTEKSQYLPEKEDWHGCRQET